MPSPLWLLRRLCIGSLLLVGLACSSDDADSDQGSNSDSLTAKWTLPADVLKAGIDASVAFDGPPAWNNGKNCPGALLAGTKALGDHLKAHFAKVTSVTGYSCRQNTSISTQTSMHGTGRAIDVMIAMIGDKADSASGDPIANWLVLHAEEIGIQYVVWNHTSWSSALHEPSDYTGNEPRVDHLHIELNAQGAAMQTPWFTGGGKGGTGGSSGAGGAAGKGGAGGSAGTTGKGGTSGTSGQGGTSGKAGAGGTSGAAGTSGKGGAAGTAGAGGAAGKGGSAGTAGTSGGGCGTVTSKGQCSGNVLSYCENSKLVTADCSLVGSGQTCGLDTKQNVYDCLGESSNGACGDITGNGVCQGNTLIFCAEGGSLIQMSCTGQGKTCGKNAQGNYYECH